MQNIFNIMSGNRAVLEFRSSLPPPSLWLLCSAHTVSLVLVWLLTWTLFAHCCLFCLYVLFFRPFLSVSTSFPAYSLSLLVSLLHPPLGDNSPCVRADERHNGSSLRIAPITEDSAEGGRTETHWISSSASLKQQMTAANCAKFSQLFSESLHVNHA